eukprot:gene16938-biopygen13632
MDTGERVEELAGYGHAEGDAQFFPRSFGHPRPSFPAFLSPGARARPLANISWGFDYGRLRSSNESEGEGTSLSCPSVPIWVKPATDRWGTGAVAQGGPGGFGNGVFLAQDTRSHGIKHIVSQCLSSAVSDQSLPARSEEQSGASPQGRFAKEEELLTPMARSVTGSECGKPLGKRGSRGSRKTAGSRESKVSRAGTRNRAGTPQQDPHHTSPPSTPPLTSMSLRPQVSVETQQKHVALTASNRCGFLAALAGDSVEGVTQWFEVQIAFVAGSVLAQGGCLDMYYADHSVASFGAVRQCAEQQAAAVRLSLILKHHDAPAPREGAESPPALPQLARTSSAGL